MRIKLNPMLAQRRYISAGHSPRLYEWAKTKRFGDCMVISTSPLTVKFLTGYVCQISLPRLYCGQIRDPFYPVVQGVGFYAEKGLRSRYQKEHDLWKSMLVRVYGNDKNYEDVTVDVLWHSLKDFIESIHSFSNYEKEGFTLDKDLRVLGNRIYGPDTCSFVPKEINNLLTRCKSSKLPNVTKTRKGYASYISIQSKKVRLGTFASEIDAYTAFLKAKVQYIKTQATAYKAELHPEVYHTLKSMTEEKLNNFYSVLSLSK